MKNFFLSLLVIVLLGFGAWYLIKLQGGKPIVPNFPQTASTTPESENMATYRNAGFGFSFSYPKQITFKNNETVSGATSQQSFNAGAPVPLGVETESSGDADVLLDVSIPATYLDVTVRAKPSNYTTLADYVADQIETQKDAGSESAAGVFVSDPNPVTVNGNKAISFSIQDGSVMNNTTLTYYFEKNSRIYTFSYFYSNAAYQGGQGIDPNQTTDEKIKVETNQKILNTLTFN